MYILTVKYIDVELLKGEKENRELDILRISEHLYI